MAMMVHNGTLKQHGCEASGFHALNFSPCSTIVWLTETQDMNVIHKGSILISWMFQFHSRLHDYKSLWSSEVFLNSQVVLMMLVLSLPGWSWVRLAAMTCDAGGPNFPKWGRENVHKLTGISEQYGTKWMNELCRHSQHKSAWVRSPPKYGTICRIMRGCLVLYKGTCKLIVSQNHIC